MAKQNWKPGNMLYPLPAVMVSCQSSTAHDPLCERPELDGKPNIITVAWAGTVCTNPPMVSISVRPERYSYHLIEESGEFVINLTTEKLVKATDYCGVRSGRDVDKFKEMHLTPLASKHIHAPGIAESPVNIECKVREIKPLGSHSMILADVVGVTIDDTLLDEKGKFELNKSGLVTYSHGEYFLLGKCSCAKFLTQILIFCDTNFSVFSGSILRKPIYIFCVKINKNLYIKQHIFYNYFRYRNRQ